MQTNSTQGTRTKTYAEMNRGDVIPGAVFLSRDFLKTTKAGRDKFSVLLESTNRPGEKFTVVRYGDASEFIIS